jgi:hypothetical protein
MKINKEEMPLINVPQTYSNINYLLARNIQTREKEQKAVPSECYTCKGTDWYAELSAQNQCFFNSAVYSAGMTPSQIIIQASCLL